MGFEARAAILETLDQAIADKAEVRVVAYDFNLPEVVDRLEKLGSSLKIIIHDSKGHGGAGTAETAAEARLVASAGRTCCASRQPAAQQDHRGEWHDCEEGRVRLDQSFMARLLRAGKQRVRNDGRC